MKHCAVFQGATWKMLNINCIHSIHTINRFICIFWWYCMKKCASLMYVSTLFSLVTPNLRRMRLHFDSAPIRQWGWEDSILVKERVYTGCGHDVARVRHSSSGPEPSGTNMRDYYFCWLPDADLQNNNRAVLEQIRIWCESGVRVWSEMLQVCLETVHPNYF